MPFSQLLLSPLILLILATVTIYLCICDPPYRIRTQFLFKGKGYYHSVVSAIGSVFSLSLFYGGTLSYGKTHTFTFSVATISVPIIIYFVMHRMLSAIPDRERAVIYSGSSTNTLFYYADFTVSKTGDKLFYLYIAAVYFLLLIVEMTLARLVFSGLFPGEPVVTAALIAILFVSCAVYVFSGGFKAVLISDYVQLIVIVVFLAALCYVGFSNNLSFPSFNKIISKAEVRAIDLASFLGMVAFAVSWMICSPDFHSRLNYAGGKSRLSFLLMSLLLMSMLIFAGIIFSVWLGMDTGQQRHPRNEFAHFPGFLPLEIPNLFMATSVPVVSSILVAAISIMIFTTADNYMISFMQCRPSRQLGRKDFSMFPYVIAAAAFLSAIIDLRYSIISGFIAGSLLVPVAVGICVPLACRSEKGPKLISLPYLLGFLGSYSISLFGLWEYLMVGPERYFLVTIIAGLSTFPAVALHLVVLEYEKRWGSRE